MVPKQVSYQATRCVTKCVPVEEEVMVTKCIPVIVDKKVAVAPACNPCDPCSTYSSSLFGGRKLFTGGLFSKCHSCHSTSSCGCGCN
jgi:hypothetical protein